MAGSSEVWAGGQEMQVGGWTLTPLVWVASSDSLPIPGPQFFALKNGRGLGMALLKTSLSSKLTLWLKVQTLQFGKLKFEPWLCFLLAVT